MEKYATIASMVGVPGSLAFIAFVLIRLRRDPNRLLKWAIILSPGVTGFLASVGWLLLKYLPYEQTELLLAALVGLLLAAFVTGYVLLWVYVVRRLRAGG